MDTSIGEGFDPGDYSEDLENYAQDYARAEAIERSYPEVVFDRFPEDGSTVAGELKPFGSCPEQAYGTIHGNPFYFRHRNDKARLVISDSEGNTILYSAHNSVESAIKHGFFTEDVFVELMHRLEPPMMVSIPEVSPTEGNF